MTMTMTMMMMTMTLDDRKRSASHIGEVGEGVLGAELEPLLTHQGHQQQQLRMGKSADSVICQDR
jgi:hypothetical protein